MAMSNNQRVIPVKIRIQKQSSWTILICNLSWPIISLHHHSSTISLSSLFSPCTTKCHHTSSAIMIDPQLSANIIMHQKHNAPSCIINHALACIPTCHDQSYTSKTIKKTSNNIIIPHGMSLFVIIHHHVLGGRCLSSPQRCVPCNGQTNNKKVYDYKW
jgi:hypothetical protein